MQTENQLNEWEFYCRAVNYFVITLGFDVKYENWEKFLLEMKDTFMWLTFEEYLKEYIDYQEE